MSKKRTIHNFLLPHSILIIIYLIFISSLAVGIYSFPQENEPREAASKNENESCIDLKIRYTKFISEKEVFFQLLDKYESDLSSFDDNIKIQSILILVTILLILRSSDKLSFFSNEVPLRWLHFFVPILLLYLWLKFGFLLDDLIEVRKQAIEFVIYSDIEDSVKEAAKAMFNDAGFIDGWILSFNDTKNLSYTGINDNFANSTRAFLILTLGLFISFGHASILGLTIIGTRRYINLKHKNWLVWYYTLPLLPLSLLLASNIQFIYGGDNPLDIQCFIALAVWPILIYFLWKSIKVDNRRFPMSINKLKRKRAAVHPGPRFNLKKEAKQSKHVAIIGDSLSTDFHVDSLPKMIMGSWFKWKKNWVLNFSDSKTGIQSIYERIGNHTSFTLFHHACAMAKVQKPKWRSLKEILLGTWHFSHQTSELLAGKFPQLILIWIGHNSLDWYNEEIKDYGFLTNRFIADYETQLNRIINRALQTENKTAIIVYGLVNFESFFKARMEAEKLKKENNLLYPYLEKDYEYFMSMKPEYRNGMILLSKELNKHIKRLCSDINQKVNNESMFLQYSDALSKVDISCASNLNYKDAWHPSEKGHMKLANAAFAPIDESLKYLNWISQSN